MAKPLRHKGRELLRDNSLSFVFLGLFVLTLLGQCTAGYYSNNQDLQDHHQAQLTFLQYLGSGHFWEALFENWESEFLQMSAYVLLTAYLFQRGSAESKDPDPPKGNSDAGKQTASRDAPWPVRRGGWMAALYGHSLSLALLLLFILSFLGHAASGAREYSHDQMTHGESGVSMLGYLGTSQFWFESFQNWQSEFFSIAVIVVLSIYLREKGSPESKEVTAPHSQTGED